jgi:hypothetical protein
MTDRRAYSRSVFLTPASAQLCVTVDGEIERWRAARAVVISSCAATRGDQLLVQIASDNDTTARWTATVMACEPIVDQATVRYRLLLSIGAARTPGRFDSVPR